jgi:hypothetical protein
MTAPVRPLAIAARTAPFTNLAETLANAGGPACEGVPASNPYPPSRSEAVDGRRFLHIYM